jgi:hypothetical protein
VRTSGFLLGFVGPSLVPCRFDLELLSTCLRILQDLRDVEAFFFSQAKQEG